MTHPATKRAVSTFLVAIGIPVDVGVVHPIGENGRSRAWWQRRPLDPGNVLQLLPRLGRENALGAAIYVRAYLPAGAADDELSPGLILVDDLSETAVDRLRGDDIEPTALVETSPKNFQAWITLRPGELTNAAARMVARSLAQTYGGDLRAVAFAQPGRLPGFTNRKECHRRPDGSAPFVILQSTSRMATSDALHRHVCAAKQLLAKQLTQPAPPPRRAETPSAENSEKEQGELEPGIVLQIDRLRDEAEARLQSQAARGHRPTASPSELDFATAIAALSAGFDQTVVTSYLSRRRPDKPPAYAARTVTAALRRLLPDADLDPGVSVSRP